MENGNTLLLLPKETEKYEWKWLLGVSSKRFHLNSIPIYLNLYNLMGLQTAKWNTSTFYEEIKMLWTALGGAGMIQRMVSTNHSQNLVPLQSTDTIWGFGAICSGKPCRGAKGPPQLLSLGRHQGNTGQQCRWMTMWVQNPYNVLPPSSLV